MQAALREGTSSWPGETWAPGLPEAALCQAGDGHPASAMGETMGPASAGHPARQPGSCGGGGAAGTRGSSGEPHLGCSQARCCRNPSRDLRPPHSQTSGWHPRPNPVPDPQCPKTQASASDLATWSPPPWTPRPAPGQCALQKQFQQPAAPSPPYEPLRRQSAPRPGLGNPTPVRPACTPRPRPQSWQDKMSLQIAKNVSM